VTLTPEAGKLRATLPDESFLLVPVTAARFRVVGSLSTFLTFELDGERVRRVALEEAGVTTLNLTPAAGR
jgi:hypothetical protein